MEGEDSICDLDCGPLKTKNAFLFRVDFISEIARVGNEIIKLVQPRYIHYID